jgi:hypothetical protein
LGVLGFLLSCYNYLIVQRRKDKDEQQKRLSDVRLRIGQQRQDAMELAVVAQLAAMGKKQTLQDILMLARQAGRPDLTDQLEKPLADAEAQLREVDARVKEILALTVPATGKIEAFLKIEESYGKLLGA